MTHAPGDFALVIGINDYPTWGPKGRNLQGATKDAEDFADWLRNPAGGGLGRERVRLVTSTSSPLHPLQPAIDAELKWIKDELKKGAAKRRFYFYFSGHGHIRIGATDDAPSLCLPNWSIESPGAALDMQSYVRAAVGCFGFDEGVFFLDCCRVMQAAPAGRCSDWECGNPNTRGRFSTWSYASDVFEAGYEGDVQGEIRGFFTSALVKILKEFAPISLLDLQSRLEVEVPRLSEDRQRPRFGGNVSGPKMRDIIFGPLQSPTTTHKSVRPSGTPAPQAPLNVNVVSNLELKIPNSPELAPQPGLISVFNDRDQRVATGVGELAASLPIGSYRIRIEHGDAAEDHLVQIPEHQSVVYQLPRRRSAAPFSGTVDSHEWASGPAREASRWSAGPGQQAIFIHLRAPGGEPAAESRSVFVTDQRFRQLDVRLGEPHPVPAGNYVLNYDGASGPARSLPLPVALGWDTQVFAVVVDGRPVLERSSVLMRKAGEGFEPRDALLDAYERALIDLSTGGPGPDSSTLNKLLWGKYENPLFGVVGAHFLLRKLANDPGDFSVTSDCKTVFNNLGRLLGESSPDVQALRLIFSDIVKTDPTVAVPMTAPPLLRSALEGVYRATASRPELLGDLRGADSLALGREPNSPWTCWRYLPSPSFGFSRGERHLTTSARQLQPGQLSRARNILELAGFKVMSYNGEIEASITPDGWSDSDAMLHKVYAAEAASRAPDWLVDLVNHELARPERQERPVTAAELARRLSLPADLIEAAMRAIAVGKHGGANTFSP